VNLRDAFWAVNGSAVLASMIYGMYTGRWGVVAVLALIGIMIFLFWAAVSGRAQHQ
jgi:hypothetical protein